MEPNPLKSSWKIWLNCGKWKIATKSTFPNGPVLTMKRTKFQLMDGEFIKAKKPRKPEITTGFWMVVEKICTTLIWKHLTRRITCSEARLQTDFFESCFTSFLVRLRWLFLGVIEVVSMENTEKMSETIKQSNFMALQWLLSIRIWKFKILKYSTNPKSF